MILILLSSGLFLGWSLGANDAANIFGTAVSSKMIKFKTAAIIGSIFVLLGAIIEGSGASHTLGKLGSVNVLGGAFTVALSAAMAVTFMTKWNLPVSTSQAIVGAIIGWNIFSQSLTSYNSLKKIVLTWIFCPVLSAIFSFLIYKTTRFVLRKVKIHLFTLDFLTRWGLIIIGAFGAYSLGANNIANVMGVFVPVSPFQDFDFLFIHITNVQILFFLGSLAISVGIITYSQRVMKTVGNDLIKLTPIASLIVVLAESLVLFLFSSKGLKTWLISYGFPSFPLVPVSSSQAVIGAVLGIALVQGGKNFKFSLLRKISLGWIFTPIIAAIMTFVFLFIVQNVFMITVYQKNSFKFSEEVVNMIKSENIELPDNMCQLEFNNEILLHNFIKNNHIQNEREIKYLSKYEPILMKKEYLKNVKVLSKFISKIPEKGLHFEYRWQFVRFINRFTTENVANVVDELYGKLYYQKILPSN
jgi:PiT family inorganic phosphate transporter